jgi:hypothetical protein
MRGEGTRWTSAACGTLDKGEIISPIDFEGLLAGTMESPRWCCIKCRDKYYEIVDMVIKRQNELLGK